MMFERLANSHNGRTPTRGVSRGDHRKCPPNAFDERLAGPGRILLEQRFNLGERLLTMGERSGDE